MNYSSIQNLMQDTIEKNKVKWYAFVIITELSDIYRLIAKGHSK